MMKKSILLMPLLLLGMVVFSQQPTKAELEKERAAIQKEIEAVKKSLEQTAKTKKATIGQLLAVQKKLRLRMAEINNINKQINLIQGDIYQSSRDIYKLKRELDTLKLQYEKSVVYAYKNRSNYDFLNFLFSSTNFNDALKRIAYLRSYRNYREQQAENIRNTQDLLKQKIAGLNENKKKKGEALAEENKQRGVLEEEKKETNTMVSKLKSKEKELNRELTAKKKQDTKLKAAIAAAINREIAEARKKAAAAKVVEEKRVEPTTTTGKTTAPAKPKSIFDTDAASIKLSESFEINKGKLPWPVEAGRVSIPFGRYSVEGLDGITGDSPGITIEADAGRPVKAVFDGDVTAVTTIGSVQCVILRHGKYFTAYSNLTDISVAKSQKVKIGQTIGRVASKENGSPDIDFIISNERSQNVDPEKWLR